MNQMDVITFDGRAAEAELADLDSLLSSKVDLDENGDLSPVIKGKKQLCALLLSLFPEQSSPDRYAHELPLSTDFIPDLCIGSWDSQTFLLVELEDAKANSVFQKSSKVFPPWSRRLERGYSQIVDWLWHLNGQRQSRNFSLTFGTPDAKFNGLLLIGRDSHIPGACKDRLKWRSNYVVVDSQKILILTYDMLLELLKKKIKHFKQIAKTL